MPVSITAGNATTFVFVPCRFDVDTTHIPACYSRGRWNFKGSVDVIWFNEFCGLG